VRVQRGANALGRARRPLCRWLDALIASLDEIGVRSGWLADAAGVQVFDLINKLKDELMRETLPVPFAEWRRWLARQLEDASFIERTVDSPVVFTYLDATSLRAFDAVLVLGCDARHLSGANEAPLFFNQNVRAELGLPTRRDQARDTEALLAALMASVPTVLLTWQKVSGGETGLLAPPIECLVALHECAYGDRLDDRHLALLIAQTEVRCEDRSSVVAATLPPAPRAAAALLPDAISASGYNTLVACPYQYHARYLLRLAELDDVQEMIEKSDYGQRVHTVLQSFHSAHAQTLALAGHEAIATLEKLSDAVFAEAISRNYLARGWLLRWKALIPEYVEWQRQREAEGWRWYAGEAERRITIRTPAGRQLTLVGRIDRVDRRADDGVAVVDYKTRAESRLKDALKVPGEDVQLPVYALLWGGPVAAALFLSIERDGVKPVAVEQGISELAQAAHDRLGVLYDAMSSGEPLPAQGAPGTCDYCEMHGLCRKAHW
jgi:ATP-dependent helicase/nuclease subunit B